MPYPKCHIFPDGDSWVVFAPLSKLVFRTNTEAAVRFRGMEDRGRADADGTRDPGRGDGVPFPPENITIACTNRCAQQCVYCYGTPAHRNCSTLDLPFCVAALDYVAHALATRGGSLNVMFHGVGEPTFFWPLFQQATLAVHDARRAHGGLPGRLFLCTGGQVGPGEAEWIARHFDNVHVSLDGPRDIHNRQRPRADGRDSFDLPLQLCRVVHGAGRELRVKVTVTAESVGRMVEIVEFVAREIGPVRVDFGMMFQPPWTAVTASPPEVGAFLQGFSEAMDRGRSLGVPVQHPTISYETLCSPHWRGMTNHFCLVPPDKVTMFYDVASEGSGDPEAGVYARYDPGRRELRVDHARRAWLLEDQSQPPCGECPCSVACWGPSGVRGRIPDLCPPVGSVCQARIGVMEELLRRTVPAQARRGGPPA